MNFSSSQHISQHSVQPISESAHLPANASPDSSAAYNAVHNEEMERHPNNQQATKDTDERNQQDENKENVPEIFRLLDKYNFKDFFRLSLGTDESALASIIKEKRASRGVDQSQPLSVAHSQSSQFLKRIATHYTKSSWLMNAKPGQSFSSSF